MPTKNIRRETTLGRDPTTNRFWLKFPTFQVNDLLQFPAKLNARKEDNSSSRTMSTRPAFYSQSDAANYIKLPPLNVNLSYQTNFTAVFVLMNRDWDID